MTYIINAYIGGKSETKEFNSKGDAIAHYRIRVSELSFPDCITVTVIHNA